MNSRVFVIHGWEGKPDSNWFPWLKKELDKNFPKIEVYVPQMPHTNNSVCEEWVAEIAKKVGKVDRNTFFVGHSLGVIAILRYVEKIPATSKIGGVISVAGFAEEIGIEELTNFLNTPVDFEKLRSVCDEFVVIDSDDDPYVPLTCGDLLAKELNAKHITMKGWKHFNESSGITEVPVVFEELTKYLLLWNV